MRLILRLTLCAAMLCFAAQSPQLRIIQPASLDFVHRNSPTTQKYLLETMGGGVAMLDYNNDGLLDLFFVNSGKLDDPVKTPVDFRRREPAFWNRLYRQNKEGTFTDVTAAAGLANAPDAYGMGVDSGDYDNDGSANLYVTAYQRNALYNNNGHRSFTDVTAAAGLINDRC